MTLPNELIPVVTLILGWLLSEAGSWFKTRREERAREKQRHESKADERVQFQRQTAPESESVVDSLPEAGPLARHARPFLMGSADVGALGSTCAAALSRPASLAFTPNPTFTKR